MSYEDARAEREFRQNPPENAPMQGDNAGWDNMPVGSSSVESVADSYNSNISKTLSGDSNNSQYQQNQPPKKSEEEVFFEIAGKLALWVWNFLKTFVKSLVNNSSGDWHRFGFNTIIVGGTCAGASVILKLFDTVMQWKGSTLDLWLGSLASLAIGVLFLMFTSKDETEDRGESTEPYTPEVTDEWQSTGEEMVYNFDEGDEEEETDWDSVLNGISSFEEEDSMVISSDGFDMDSALNSLPTITSGTQTRQYLFEAFTKVLPLVTPNYSSMTEISPEEDRFFVFEDYLRSAAEQVGTKEENIPELLYLYENPFIYKLDCSRPAGMKEQQIADEIAKAYAWDVDPSKVKKGVYAKIETIPGKCIISVFKGFIEDPYTMKQIGGVSISLGDVYKQISPFICNPSIEIPFVWGVNEKGTTLYCDMIDNNTTIISGMPRGGKSWKGQSMVAQFAMFNSPKDINFYILDNKGTASDYYHLSTVLPHVKYFCGRFDKMNDSLEQIINMMLNTNGKKLEEAGEINIKDYNKKYPNDKLPYAYVIIDELQALMNYFEESNQKEEAQRFRSYLSTMTSKLPYVGLRFIMFPHRIVNQIISKDAYTLVSSRVVVNQLDGKEVENAVGVSEAKFGYKLPQKGDMAIKLGQINGGEACFCHAEMLTNSNEGNRALFEYIGSVWRKLEPSCECIEIKGSMGGKITKFSSTSSNSSSYERFAKPEKVVRDNTNGNDSYVYQGFSSGSSLEELGNEGYITDEEDPSIDTSTEEDFWETLLAEESE